MDLTLDVITLPVIYFPVIKSFKCGETERLYKEGKSKRFSAFRKVARRKLRMIDAATILADLLVPPSNRLEKMEGTRKGQHSIRINRQYRVCFVWLNGDAHNVEIRDYHDEPKK